MSNPIVKQKQLPFTSQEIWNALTNTTAMQKWYFDIPDFELKEGSTFNFYEPGGAKKFHHQCTIRKIENEATLSHTWTHPSHSRGESLLTWNIQPNENGTLVTLTHEGLENFSDAGPEFARDNYDIGWEGILSGLTNFLKGLEKITYSLPIQASADEVWKCLFLPENYAQWIVPFCEGSQIKGTLEQGSRIHFLNPSGCGLYSNLVMLQMPNYTIFQHVGEIENFEEKPEDPGSPWHGAVESYSIMQLGAVSHLAVEMDTTPEYKNYMLETFEKAFAIVKKLAERT